MKYSDNTTIIEEYRDAFRKYANHGIIDMDDYLKHSFNFQIHRLEQVIEAWDGVIPPYRQSQFFITLIKTGRGEKTIGHFSFPIQKNTLLIIPQNLAQSSKYRSLNCSGFMLSFDAGFFFQHFLPKHLIARKRVFRKSSKLQRIGWLIQRTDPKERQNRTIRSVLRWRPPYAPQSSEFPDEEIYRHDSQAYHNRSYFLRSKKHVGLNLAHCKRDCLWIGIRLSWLFFLLF